MVWIAGEASPPSCCSGISLLSRTQLDEPSRVRTLLKQVGSSKASSEEHEALLRMRNHGCPPRQTSRTPAACSPYCVDHLLYI